MNEVIFTLPDTATDIIMAVVAVALFASALLSIYVDRRKLKAVKEIEGQAAYIEEALRGDMPERERGDPAIFLAQGHRAA